MLREEKNLFLESLAVHRVDWVVVFAYFDETFGGAHGDLTAVAGYLFRADDAARFEGFYRKEVEPLLPLDKNEEKVFHASALFEGADQFFGIDRPLRECALSRMASIIGQTVTVGAVMGIEQAEYDAGLKGRYISVQVGKKRAPSLQPWVGSAYAVCLLRCIHGMNAWLDSKKIDGEIEYVIEAGTKRQDDEASALLSRIALSPLAKRYRYRRHAVVRKGPKDPWLFASDYFAWVWQKNDRLGEGVLTDEYGDWRTPVEPLLDSKPHIASYLTEQSVNVQALVNAFNGLMRPSRDDAF